MSQQKLSVVQETEPVQLKRVPLRKKRKRSTLCKDAAVMIDCPKDWSLLRSLSLPSSSRSERVQFVGLLKHWPNSIDNLRTFPT